MLHKDIRDLLKKYLRGDATPDQERLVDEWYDSLSSGEEQVNLSEDERRTLRESYWRSLRNRIRTARKGRTVLWPRAVAAAACVSLVVLAAFVYLNREITPVVAPNMQQGISMHEIVNDSSSVRRVELPDGSVVALSPGSKLEYSDEFNVQERKISLSGEAFFEIFHNARKPFYVFANEVVTKVLGTSFCVKAYPGDADITVSVRTGKVSVYTHFAEDPVRAESEKIILTPNQKAVYSRNDNKVSRMLVKNPEVVMPEEEVKKIRFEGAAASDIFKALEKMYGVDIVFEEEKFSNCFLTTSLKSDDLYGRIDVICEITGATYSIQDTRIVITGTGCN